MSLKAFEKDEKFGIKGENKLSSILTNLGRKVKPTSKTDILDFYIEDKNGNEVWLEIKRRRCKKDTYPDSMIGLNKLIEAYKRYNEGGLYTLFLFYFEDGLYYINPFFHLPRFDYKKGRWDRGSFDKPKGWAYYDVNDLTLIYN